MRTLTMFRIILMPLVCRGRHRHWRSVTKQRSSSCIFIILSSLKHIRFFNAKDPINIDTFPNTHNTGHPTYKIYWFNMSNTKTGMPSFKWMSMGFLWSNINETTIVNLFTNTMTLHCTDFGGLRINRNLVFYMWM